MDEIKKEALELEEKQTPEVISTEETATAKDNECARVEAIAESELSREDDALADESAPVAEDADDNEEDSAFAVNQVESEAAFEELTALESDDEDAMTESDMPLANYAADCESCATKVFFELEDLQEDGNLICPNCSEKIEIEKDAIDYYLVQKPAPEESGQGEYVVTCSGCEADVYFSPDEIDEDENIICPQCGEAIHIDSEDLDQYNLILIEKKHKKKILKRVAVIICGVLAALAVCVTGLYFAGQNSVLTVGKTAVPMYMYQAIYYGENASACVNYGFDMSKKPSEQPFPQDSYETWDDFFKEQTMNTLKLYYGIYNSGKNAGFEMTDEDKAVVDDTLQNLQSLADKNDMSVEDYLRENYGLTITLNQFKEYLTFCAYINAYHTYYLTKDVSDEQLEEIYQADPDSYDIVSCRYFYLSISESMDEQTALQIIDTIAAAKTADEFYTLIQKFVPEDQLGVFTGEDITKLKDVSCASIISNFDEAPAAFVCSDKAKAGESYAAVSQDKTRAEVFLMETPRHKDIVALKSAAIDSDKANEFKAKIEKETIIKNSIGSILLQFMF